MVSKSSYTLVGAFVLVLGAVFIWGVLWISAGGPPQRIDRYLVYMTESVSGLNVDSPLKFRGVEVGKIEQISIDIKNPERIRLLIQVRQGTPITEDTVATLEFQGLTGIANINLSGGQADSQPLSKMPREEYPVIQTKPSLFARLNADMPDLLATLIQTSLDISALLNEENRANVSRSLENVAVLTDNLAKQSDKLDTIISDLSVTLKNTRTASEDFPELVNQFSQSAEAISGMIEQIGGIGENLASASTGIHQTVESSGDDLVYFTSTTLPELAEMVFELRLAAEYLRRMSEALAQDPSVLIYGSPTPEPGPGE